MRRPGGISGYPQFWADWQLLCLSLEWDGRVSRQTGQSNGSQATEKTASPDLL
jgi:hypothetical protein